jgi:hypothetical protein
MSVCLQKKTNSAVTPGKDKNPSAIDAQTCEIWDMLPSNWEKKGTTLSTELDRATSPRRTSPGLHTEEKHWMNLWGCGKITDFSFVSFSGQWIPYILRYYMVLLSHLFNICSSPWLTLTPYGHWIASHTLEVTSLSLTLGKVLYSKQFLALTLTSRQIL